MPVLWRFCPTIVIASFIHHESANEIMSLDANIDQYVWYTTQIMLSTVPRH